jgi:signal transduction histidine kinase
VNRLWVRLTILFSTVVLVAAGILVLITLLITQESVVRYIVNSTISRPGALKDRLSEYYEEHHTWDGVNDIIDLRMMSPIAEGIPLTMRSLEGAEYPLRVAYPNGQRITEEAFPIRNENGVIQGYLVARYPAFNYEEYMSMLGRIVLIIAFVSTCVGLVFAVFVSRNLTAPLTHLSDAALEIGSHNLSARVSPAGTYEMVELANSFNAMASDLEHGEKLRRDLLADTAHELRTPLSVLTGNLRAILDDVYPLDKAEVARLYEQSRLLNRLVSDLHELAQAEARQLPLYRQPTDVAPWLENTLLAFEPLAEEEQVTLSTALADALPSVNIDNARMSQVIHNLLANALRHTSAGGSIELRASQQDGQLKIEVQDSGEGIAPEDLPHVFDRFYRADRTRTRSTGGSGLGLAIAKAIVESHGGTIQVISAFGHGATFVILLPLETASGTT